MLVAPEQACIHARSSLGCIACNSDASTTYPLLLQVGDTEYGEPVVSVQLTVNSRPASGSSAIVSVSAVPLYQVRALSVSAT